MHQSKAETRVLLHLFFFAPHTVRQSYVPLADARPFKPRASARGLRTLTRGEGNRRLSDNKQMHRRTFLTFAPALGFLASCARSSKIRLALNWKPDPEFGGFYAA